MKNYPTITLTAAWLCYACLLITIFLLNFIFCFGQKLWWFVTMALWLWQWCEMTWHQATGCHNLSQMKEIFSILQDIHDIVDIVGVTIKVSLNHDNFWNFIQWFDLVIWYSFLNQENVSFRFIERFMWELEQFDRLLLCLWSCFLYSSLKCDILWHMVTDG